MKHTGRNALCSMRRRVHHAAWLLVLSLAAACGSDDPPTAPPADPPDDPPTCAPEQTLPGGGCVANGLPPEACGVGFELDAQQGCAPILPAEACPDGEMAVPGEAACRPVAPCTDAPYGEAPIEADTQFVDGAYPGDDSDGTEARPWKTVKDGISAAASGAVVAIAAGSYDEGLWSQGKSVRLWGRCPAMTELVGSLEGYAVVELSRGDGAELHDLSITGVSFGVYSYDAKAIVLDRVHIHDTGLEGITAFGDQGPVEVALRRSLVERAVNNGVAGNEATLTISDSVIRDIQDQGAVPAGGVYAQAGAVLTMTNSVSSGHYLGVGARDSQASLDGVVVRDTRIGLGNSIEPQGASTIDARRSVIERYQEFGAYNDSTMTLTAMVFRDGIPADGSIPTAMGFNTGSWGGCGQCLVERGVAGVVSRGAEVGFEFLTVRDMSRLGASLLESSTAHITASTFERTGGVGVYVASGSTANLLELVVRDTAAIDGVYGDGVTSASGNIEVSQVRIEGSARCGVSNFGGTVRLGDAVLECNAIDIDGEAAGEAAFSFEEGDGPNTCGCDGEERACQVVSSSLAAPSIEGLTD